MADPPLAALVYPAHGDKKLRHALPIDRSDGAAFCGLDPRFEGWQNFGSLRGNPLPAFQSGYCHPCMVKARQLAVLQTIGQLGGHAVFADVKRLRSPLDEDRELDAILVNLVGASLLEVEVTSGTYPNRVRFHLTVGGRAELERFVTS